MAFTDRSKFIFAILFVAGGSTIIFGGLGIIYADPLYNRIGLYSSAVAAVAAFGLRKIRIKEPKGPQSETVDSETVQEDLG